MPTMWGNRQLTLKVLAGKYIVEIPLFHVAYTVGLNYMYTNNPNTKYLLASAYAHPS